MFVFENRQTNRHPLIYYKDKKKTFYPCFFDGFSYILKHVYFASFLIMGIAMHNYNSQAKAEQSKGSYREINHLLARFGTEIPIIRPRGSFNYL